MKIALAWTSTVTKPRIATLELKYQHTRRFAFYYLFLRHCVVYSLQIRWSAEFSEFDLLPATTVLFEGTSKFALDASNAILVQEVEPLLKRLSSSILDLSLRLPPLKCAWLTSALSTLTALSKLTLDAELYRPGPIIWLEGLDTSFPHLGTFHWDLKRSSHIELLIIEVPSSVTNLRLAANHRQIPIILWPPSLLHLELEFESHPDSGVSPISRIIEALNWASLQLLNPRLTHLSYKPPRIADKNSFNSDWVQFLALVGESSLERLAPPSLNLGRFFDHISDYGLNLYITRIFLGSLTHLKLCVSHDELGRLSSILNSCLHSLATLKIIIESSGDASRFETLPSSITSLTLRGLPLVRSVLEGLLPPSLTLLDAEFASLSALVAAREKLGPKVGIVTHSWVAVTTELLAALFPKYTTNAPGSPPGEPPCVPGETIPLPAVKTGPYGSYDICNANGDWSVTLPTILNRLIPLLGLRTSVTLHMPYHVDWPSNVTNVCLEDLRSCKCGIGLVLNSVGSRTYFPDALSLKLSESPETSNSEAGSPKWTSLDLGNGSVPKKRMPASLTILKANGGSTLDWSHLALDAPRLTILHVPEVECSLNSTLLPIGLRELSLKINPRLHDFKLKQLLSHLPHLEKASFSASGLILTAPNWGPSLSLQDVGTQLSSYLRPNANCECLIKDSGEFQIAIHLLPRTLTSLNLLRTAWIRSLSQTELPPGLTDFRDVFYEGAHLPLLSSLKTFHAHCKYEYNPIFTCNLPPTLEHLIVTTHGSLFNRFEASLTELAPRIFPCNNSLRSIVAPCCALDTLVSTAETANYCVLPNLTRLIMNAAHCADVKLNIILKDHFPNLSRLTLTTHLKLTGGLISVTPSLVSFESMARLTWDVLFQTLKSKRLSSAPENNDSNKESLNASPTTQSPLRANIDDALAPELNVVFDVFVSIPPRPFCLPPDTTHVSLLPRKRDSASLLELHFLLDFSKSMADTIEHEVRWRSERKIPDSSFDSAYELTWAIITNANALNMLVEIEYGSLAYYKPGTFFAQYQSLKTLKIHAPIDITKGRAASSHQWILPTGLTHLTVSKAPRSFDFVTQDDDKISQLLTLELPRAVWQPEDALPCNLSRLSLLDFRLKDLHQQLVDRGCEVVFT